MPDRDIKFYNKEFPNTFNDFVYLSREFRDDEIILCDKDGLRALCIALKKKELEYYIDRNEAINLLEKALLFIDSGAVMHTNKERVELVDEIRAYFGINH